MKKIVARVLVVIFVLIAVFVTGNLLAYNDYEVAEFGDKSLVLVDNYMVKDGYKKGDLLVTTRKSNDSIKVGDSIIFYNVDRKVITIDKGSIEEISDNGEQFFVSFLNMESEKKTTSVLKENVLGTSDSVKTYPVVGSILNVLEARTGYLLIILLPTLVLFAYLIRNVVVELKEDKKN